MGTKISSSKFDKQDHMTYNLERRQKLSSDERKLNLASMCNFMCVCVYMYIYNTDSGIHEINFY